MKIAIIRYDLLTKGGGPRQMLELAINLQQQGHTVTIFTYGYNQEEGYADLCRKLDIRFVKNECTATGSDLNIDSKNILRRFINGLIWLRNEMRKIKAMTDLITEQYDIINIHEWPGNWAAWYLRKKFKTPIVWMCNDIWHFPPDNKNQSLTKRIANTVRFVYLNPARIFDKLATRYIQKITVLDSRIKGLIDSYYSANSVIVRSGVDIERLTSMADPNARKIICEKHHLPANSFFLLCASIYFAHRRFEDALCALSSLESKYPNIHLMIVGSTRLDPEYAKKINNLISELRLESRVTRVNEFISDQDLYRYYQACDLFIFPNNHQTWGLAPIEAMTLGKPVLVSTGAGVHEVIEDGKNGILFPPENPKILREKIEFLYKNESDRKRIAASGYEYVKRNFSWQKYTAQMLNVFKQIL